MKLYIIFTLTFLPVIAFAQTFTRPEIERAEAMAKTVTIIRDKWGVPHIYAKTDAAVVFGLMYSQCEDNFKGIERNYLDQLGRQAEVDGENSLYTDVQLQLIADSTDAIKDYKASDPGFKKLMDAFADGINYYLYKHPQVKPLVFKRFEPWYALMFTDGSVAATETGGINLAETKDFYAGEGEKLGTIINKPANLYDAVNERETGSNGFAISPSRSASGHALLYINPHVPFYFRSEVELVSNEGLHAYGAVTWGQFFIYQGFNEHCGWMHTSSYADVGDLYAEKMVKKEGKWYYEYDGSLKPVTARKLMLHVKKDNRLEQKNIIGYYTHHGPVLGSRNGNWLSLRANNRSYNALLESWLITKANTLADYKKAMELVSNTSNSTVYADDKGNIIFWYGNYIPKRNPSFDWSLPVDGSTSATEWLGVHQLKDIITDMNPATGWIQNCNSTPYTASGVSSPDKKKYPVYMAPDGENYRALTAIKLLKNANHITLDDLIAKGYDHYLAVFDDLLPPLFKAYNNAPDSVKQSLAEPVELLRQWDRRSAANSVATTLAIEWGTLMMRIMPPPQTSEQSTFITQRVKKLSQTDGRQQLDFLAEVLKSLQSRFGSWKIEWGTINRYQRPADGTTFDDKLPSIPVGATGSGFGQLPSFQSRTANTQKRYGYSGNSFVAAVEFGPRIKAKSIITGGQSFDPASKNFTDQAQGFIDGKFKDVLFYKSDVLKHVQKIYHPGD
ncbi:penicillin acylase family protein [Mucilaginibacter pocheonensis]|uniref:Acyl-homoserine lactone acylase PvdQ n=1 Tax=Mucilaginibacter pocheonensis TaxID=398050 RepID=A0ABU1THN0_9SPHI|nr:penicillin acylase family protein [Mucilaginibacter pocheonensis]MDR6944920.1 acyl-homoserine lactone acylase PvdQ [Mucilaginibacter pocheonensis]